MRGPADLGHLTRLVAAAAGASVELARPGDPGSAVIRLAGPVGGASISLQGAQVLSWQPAGIGEMLWCSPMVEPGSGKPMRGGIPICWPWFGVDAAVPARPQHGYARNAIWDLEALSASADGWSLELAYRAGAGSIGAEHLIAGLGARLAVRVGAGLHLVLSSRNGGTAPAVVATALHTYFRVGDIRAVRVVGLDGADFRDNTDGGRIKRQRGDVSIASETVALFDHSPSALTLDDPALGRRVVIERGGGASTVVWNPMAAARSIVDVPTGEETRFLCVESGAIGAASVTLDPGLDHVVSVRYTVTAAPSR